MMRISVFFLLLFVYSYLNVSTFHGSIESGSNETLVLAYVAFIVSFILFMLLATFYKVSNQASRPKVEQFLVSGLLGPYLVFTWRTKYSVIPLLSESNIILLLIIIQGFWLLDKANLTKGFEWAASLGVGANSELVPGRGPEEKYKNMRIAVIVAFLIPIIFWWTNGVFV